ncbi:uncharacterized protein LOC144126849 [Amblyomma americanum]
MQRFSFETGRKLKKTFFKKSLNIFFWKKGFLLSPTLHPQLNLHCKAISEEKTALCASALANFLRDSNKKEVLYYYVQMELEESRGNRGAKEAAFLPLLAALFKDDVGQLFRVFEEGTSITERLHELPCTPTVVAHGKLLYTS